MLRWLRPLLSPQAARAVLSGQPALCAGLFGDHDRPLCARRWGGRQVSAHSSFSAREFGIRQACRHRGRQGLHLAGAHHTASNNYVVTGARTLLPLLRDSPNGTYPNGGQMPCTDT